MKKRKGTLQAEIPLQEQEILDPEDNCILGYLETMSCKMRDGNIQLHDL